MPSFTLGHHNIQVISFKDFYVDLTPEEQERVTKDPIEVRVNIDLDTEASIPDIE